MSTTDREKLSSFAEFLSDPSNWVDKAEELLFVASELEHKVAAWWKADLLREEGEQYEYPPDCKTTYLMVVAYALENLLKAAIIRRDQKAIRDEVLSTKRLPARIKTHKLFDLVDSLGAEIEVEDEELLRRLSKCAIWSGRYPVSGRFTPELGTESFSDGNNQFIAWYAPDDPLRARILIQDLRSQLAV